MRDIGKLLIILAVVGVLTASAETTTNSFINKLTFDAEKGDAVALTTLDGVFKIKRLEQFF